MHLHSDIRRSSSSDESFENVERRENRSPNDQNSPPSPTLSSVSASRNLDGPVTDSINSVRNGGTGSRVTTMKYSASVSNNPTGTDSTQGNSQAVSDRENSHILGRCLHQQWLVMHETLDGTHLWIYTQKSCIEKALS